MIFSPHIIVGAVIGAKTQNLGLIVILGLLSHFIMDWIPHWHYSAVSNLKKFKKTKSSKFLFLAFSQMAIDVSIGLLIVLLLLWYKNILNLDYLPFILFAIFMSLLPDIGIGFVLLSVPEKISKPYINFCQKYLHRPENIEHIEKEGDLTFLNITSTALITIIAIIILLL